MTTRRTALAGMGALAAMLAAAGTSAGPAPRMPRKLVRPPRLKTGDKVGLVAPAGFVPDRFGIDELTATVRAMGLEPRLAPNLQERYGYLAGTDQSRAAALNAMFRAPDLRAIFAVRGGWGSERILPSLDFAALAANPKLLVGSSDITALHMAIAARTSLPSVHAPNVSSSWGARLVGAVPPDGVRG